MLDRSTHVFLGVVEREQIEFRPFFRVPGDDSRYWKVLRRRVRVEAVLKGHEPRSPVDIYEIVCTGGVTGDWNWTAEGSRYLFLVHTESGRYRVVRDWWRSIFEVHSGFHTRLPMDNSKPFWERVALLMLWIQPDYSSQFAHATHKDPGGTLSRWRTVKILRGLLRHPDREVRMSACEGLAVRGKGAG